MNYKAKIEIDVQKVFDELQSEEQKEFIKNNLLVLDNDILIEALEANGRQVRIIW